MHRLEPTWKSFARRCELCGIWVVAGAALIRRLQPRLRLGPSSARWHLARCISHSGKGPEKRRSGKRVLALSRNADAANSRPQSWMHPIRSLLWKAFGKSCIILARVRISEVRTIRVMTPSMPTLLFDRQFRRWSGLCSLCRCLPTPKRVHIQIQFQREKSV